MDAHETKTLVRDKYAEIATGKTSCCGKRTAASAYAGVGAAYGEVEGYVRDADLGLGCGVPTELARLAPGQTVLDLGCGAGNDVFIARRCVGDAGRVIGLDFTPEMLAKAEANRSKLGYDNVEFRQGEIEAMPVADAEVDVVISNCVLNLVPDKRAAFAEIFRVLKPGGHFTVSDIVLEGELPAKMKSAAELYVGCVAGALQRTEYLDAVRGAGFEAVEVPKAREIQIPDADLLQELNEDELRAFRASGTRIVSATVVGTKPGA
jgi:arsenite methyltransferase